MELFELKKLVCDKLKVAPWSVVDYNSQSVEVKIRGRKFLISTALCVCDAGARFYDGNDSDARQLEKLLRGEQWNGTGLPPVGTECEYKDTQTGEWMPVNIKYASDQIVVLMGCERLWGTLVEIAKDVVIDKPEFRPLRTERDKAVEQMIEFHRNTLGSHDDSMRQLYDAIVAGKIDGLGKVG